MGVEKTSYLKVYVSRLIWCEYSKGCVAYDEFENLKVIFEIMPLQQKYW